MRPRETYRYYLDGGNAGDNADILLAYHKTMLDGYQIYLRSVTDGEDHFDEKRDSVYYRSLCEDYTTKYAPLSAVVSEAEAAQAEAEAETAVNTARSKVEASKVQIYVSSADIGNLKVGDEIRYNISALPGSQYGTVSGKVLSISQDALAQGGQYSGYFLVEGSIGDTEPRDKDGNIEKITIGIQAEAKIVTQTKTIIRYLLEKINLFRPGGGRAWWAASRMETQH